MTRSSQVIMAVLVLLVLATPASATLHLACVPTAGVTCASQTFNGTPIIATTSSLPTFGIRSSPGTSYTSSASLTIAILVPSQAPTGLNFSMNWGSATATATQYSATPWSSGFLIPYLGLQQAGGPAAPIDAYTTPASVVNPGTTGFTVYLATFSGPMALSNMASGNANFSVNGIAGLPAGTIFYAFITDKVTTCTHGRHPVCTTSIKVVDTTANSSAMMLTPTPEPGSMFLFGSGLILMGGALRRKLSVSRS